MYADEDLVSAVKAGVLTEEAVRAFRQHVAETRKAPAVDEEYVRLLTGFNDIFVVIACVLLLMALGWIGGTWTPWLGGAAIAVAAWGLAEIFTAKRRMALPSIVLVLAFVGGVFGAAIGAQTSYELAGAVAAVAAWVHWRRFKVPITVAATVAAALAGLASAIVNAPALHVWSSLIVLLMGVAVFLLAMRWDATDSLRETRRSDVAFWLHLLAAPLLVHPVFAALGFDGKVHLGQALGVIGAYALVSLVSLAIDRRALMVSALAYVLYAFSALLKQYGVISLGFAVTALVIGTALLLLSVFWHASRAWVLRVFPARWQPWLAPQH